MKVTRDRTKEITKFIKRIRNTATGYDKGGVLGAALLECADELEKLVDENQTFREIMLKTIRDNNITSEKSHGSQEKII